MKIRISRLDRLFSTYIRTRDRWTCQRCLKSHPERNGGLHCAHMFSRAKKSTRFDPENAVAMCYGCHSYIDSEPEEKIKFFEARMGKEKFDLLRLRANRLGKIDTVLIGITLKQAIKQLSDKG